MALNVGILMDPIEHIKPYKDTSFAILLAAQARGANLHYLTPADLAWIKASPRSNAAFAGGRSNRALF